MDENMEMLSFIFKNAEMGYLSCLDTLKLLKKKDNKINKDLEKITNLYKKYLDDSKKIIKKNKYTLSKNSLITKISSKMGIEMELNKDNSDSAIAKMLIQGLTMGEIDIESKIKSYSNSLNKDILTFADNYKNFQQDYINILKNYL